MKIFVLIAIILIGAIGYLEKILKFQLSRVSIIFLFSLFIIFSFAQIKVSFDNDKKINLLKSNIGDSDNKLAELRNKTDAQDNKMVSLRSKLEESNKNLVEIKKKAAPRKITPEQRAKLATALKTIPTPMPLWFGVLVGDAEAEDYSRELRTLFAECGHPVPKERIGYQMTMPKPRGVWLYIASERDSAVAIAAELQHAFKAAGLNLQAGIQEGEPPRRIRLVVGEKP